MKQEVDKLKAQVAAAQMQPPAARASITGVASSSADDVEGVLGLLGTKLSPMMQAQAVSSGRLSPLGGAVLGGSAMSLFPGVMNAERLRLATYF